MTRDRTTIGGSVCGKRTFDWRSQLRVLKHRHLHGDPGSPDLVFEIDSDLRIFIFVFDQGTALANARANSLFIDGLPDAEKIFSRLAAIAKRQLARFLLSRIKVLMKPSGRRAENTALTPVYSDDLITVAGLVWTYTRFLRPHQGVPFGAQDQQNRAPRMVVGLVIPPYRPLGEVTHQRTTSHVERGYAHAIALCLGGIHQRPTSIGDKVRLPVKKTALKLPIRCRYEIIGPPVKALVECMVATKHKRDVMEQVDHQRRAGHRQKNRWLSAAIDHSMPTVQGNRK